MSNLKSTEMERKEKKEEKKNIPRLLSVNGAENCLRNTSIFSLQIFPSLRSIVALDTDGGILCNSNPKYCDCSLQKCTGTKEQRVVVCGILQKRNDLKLLFCSPKWIWTWIQEGVREEGCEGIA